MEYRVQTLDGFKFREGGLISGDDLRDPRPLQQQQQQQTAPQHGSGSGPSRPDGEPETKKPGSIKRAMNGVLKLVCSS
jgi:hypothetical protein